MLFLKVFCPLVQIIEKQVGLPSPAAIEVFKSAAVFAASQLTPSSAADGLCEGERPVDRGPFKAMIGASDRRACLGANCTAASENENWVMAANTSYENINGSIIWTTNSAGIVIGDSEHGAISPGSSASNVWTGLSNGWQVANNCTDWTTTLSDIGSIGISNATNSSTWGNFGSSCNSTLSIYCVEQ